MAMEWPKGKYDVWADDDDVIGLTVARTHPHGYFIVRTEPPFMDAFDEYEVARFLADCLTHADAVRAAIPEQEQ